MRPTTRTCPVCGGTARYVTCGQVACRQAYQRVRLRTRMASQRASDHAYQHALEHYRRDSAAWIDAQYAAARAARLARERATGVRTFTVQDGWAQKAGRCCMDGEMRLSEVEGA